MHTQYCSLACSHYQGWAYCLRQTMKAYPYWTLLVRLGSMFTRWWLVCEHCLAKQGNTTTTVWLSMLVIHHLFSYHLEAFVCPANTLQFWGAYCAYNVKCCIGGLLYWVFTSSGLLPVWLCTLLVCIHFSNIDFGWLLAYTHRVVAYLCMALFLGCRLDSNQFMSMGRCLP